MAEDIYTQSRVAQTLRDLKDYMESQRTETTYEGVTEDKFLKFQNAYFSIAPEREKVAEEVASEWFHRMPVKFRPFKKHYRKIIPKVRKITLIRYPTGEAVIRYQHDVLGYLEKLYSELGKTIGSYKELIDGLGGVTWANPVLGEILAKKTPQLLDEIKGDIQKYSAVCYDLQEPLEFVGPGEGSF